MTYKAPRSTVSMNLIENWTSDNVCEVVILVEKQDDEKSASATKVLCTEDHSKTLVTTEM